MVHIGSNRTLVKASGAYHVGTSRYDLAKESCDDRMLTVQFWYPTSEQDNGEKAKWMANPAMAKHFTQVTKLPLFVTQQLANIVTDSALDAKLSEHCQRYPVILFSHGYAGFIGQNTTLMQELASHGYIVCSIAHTLDCFAVSRGEGQVIPMDMDRFGAFHNGDNDSYFDMLLEIRGLPDYEKGMMEWQYLKENPLKETLVQKWIEDQKYVIEVLEKMNKGMLPSTFKDRLDLEHLGCLGHSFGGAVALNHAFTDSKIKAVANMDGFMFGNVNQWDIKTPVLFMNASNKIKRHYHSGAVMNKGIFDRCKQDAYHIHIENAYHMNFSDLGYVGMPLKLVGVLGKIENVKMMKIMNQCLLFYFNKYLKDENTVDMEDLCKAFKEVYVNQK